MENDIKCPRTVRDQDPNDPSRRDFIKQTSLITAVALAPATVTKAADELIADAPAQKLPLKMEVNGTVQSLSVEPRATLLDILREQLDLTGTKKGCDHGQCGACTVHIDGQRVNSCLTLG